MDRLKSAWVWTPARMPARSMDRCSPPKWRLLSLLLSSHLCHNKMKRISRLFSRYPRGQISRALSTILRIRMLVYPRTLLVCLALCLELLGCPVGNAWKLVIAVNPMSKRSLSLKNQHLNYLNRFLWVKMKIARMNNPKVFSNYQVMSSIRQIWKNSNRKLRRWPNLCLVFLQISLHFHW